MKFQSKIDDQEVTIDLNENCKYGIMLSGGLDSAVLFYLVLLTAKKENKDLTIQPFSMIKTDGSFRYVNSIVAYFNEQFGIRVPDTVLVGDPTIDHKLQSTFATKEVFKNFPHIDFLFNGVNQNPPVAWGETCAPERVKQSPSNKVIMPFVNLQKSHIIDLMFQHKQEYLANITHSCTEQVIGRCNVCFQCQERHWGFEQLGKIDTGIL